MNKIESYGSQISDLLRQIQGEEASLRKAAAVICDSVEKDLMVHVIGPGGHSNMAVEEVLWRAGGLMISPLLRGASAMTKRQRMAPQAAKRLIRSLQSRQHRSCRRLLPLRLLSLRLRLMPLPDRPPKW